jgi:hypothetical protein
MGFSPYFLIDRGFMSSIMNLKFIIFKFILER